MIISWTFALYTWKQRIYVVENIKYIKLRKKKICSRKYKQIKLRKYKDFMDMFMRVRQRLIIDL